MLSTMLADGDDWGVGGRRWSKRTGIGSSSIPVAGRGSENARVKIDLITVPDDPQPLAFGPRRYLITPRIGAGEGAGALDARTWAREFLSANGAAPPIEINPMLRLDRTTKDGRRVRHASKPVQLYPGVADRSRARKHPERTGAAVEK